jgi:hypothetical protein
VFDLLRFDILTPYQGRALVAHLNEREFLSANGVHSLAKTDLGYDPKDVDWGGPGVYTGDAPELVEDLYHAGFMAQGDDLLRRLRWWGRRFPYYPQAIRADAEDYRHDGRSNIAAALKVNEAMLFGLLGLRVGYDGSVSVAPHLPSWLPDYTFRDIRIGKKGFTISVNADGFTLTTTGGKLTKGKLDERVTL